MPRNSLARSVIRSRTRLVRPTFTVCSSNKPQSNSVFFARCPLSTLSPSRLCRASTPSPLNPKTSSENLSPILESTLPPPRIPPKRHISSLHGEFHPNAQGFSRHYASLLTAYSPFSTSQVRIRSQPCRNSLTALQNQDSLLLQIACNRISHLNPTNPQCPNIVDAIRLLHLFYIFRSFKDPALCGRFF